MTRLDDHIALANVNHKTLVYLLDRADHHSEWIATVAFYKALHIVEALFAMRGIPATDSHIARSQAMKDNPPFDHIHSHYRTLWESSTIARYLSDCSGSPNPRVYSRFADHMSPDKVRSQLIDHRLKSIEKSAMFLAREEQFRALERIA